MEGVSLAGRIEIKGRFGSAASIRSGRKRWRARENGPSRAGTPGRDNIECGMEVGHRARKVGLQTDDVDADPRDERKNGECADQARRQVPEADRRLARSPRRTREAD